MFAPPLVPVPRLVAHDVEAVVDVALNPERSAVERVSALHRLRGADDAGAFAHRLAPILNEPLHWVAGEALAVLNAIAPDIAMGVDRGLFVAVDGDDLVDDGRFRFSPEFGPTAVPFDLSELPGCPAVPWTFRRPASVVVDIVTGTGPPALRVLTADGARTIDIGPDQTGVWRRAGPRLRLTFRHGDCLVQRRLAPGATDGDGVVTVNGAPLQSAGITVRRLTTGNVVDFGVGVVHASGVEFDDEGHHALRIRAFIPDRSGRGLAVVNDAMRAIGEVFVVAGLGHVVALDTEEFGVVAVDGAGVHVHRGTLALPPEGIQVGPMRLTAADARNGRRGLVINDAGRVDRDGNDDHDDDDDDDAV